MDIYREFACLYTRGPWPSYSQRMAEALPQVLEKFNVKPQAILDLACGDGTFAVAMAKAGIRVSGVDLSPDMLKLAKEKARRAGVSVRFLLQDMRSLTFKEKFDLATCWYDSLNYLLQVEDLGKAFASASSVLKTGGFFIFDVNTPYGLRAGSTTAVQYQHGSSSVVVDSGNLFAVNSYLYDFDNDIVKRRITGFVRQGRSWRRIEETHRERGYRLEDIRQSLKSAGLQELACSASFPEISELKPEAKRIWFVVKKQA